MGFFTFFCFVQFFFGVYFLFFKYSPATESRRLHYVGRLFMLRFNKFRSQRGDLIFIQIDVAANCGLRTRI